MKLEPDLSDSAQGQMGFDFDAPTDAQERTELEREDAHFYIARMRESLEGAGKKPHDMRTPCQFCDCRVGVLVVQGGQNTVKCAQCRRHSYNAPKTETGQITRTVRTLRTGMKPAQQARILDRDHGRCILCGASDDLSIGHLLSIADGARLGATESELNDDANLAAMCEGCNAGLGARSILTRTYLIIMLRILQAEIRRNKTPR